MEKEITVFARCVKRTAAHGDFIAAGIRPIRQGGRFPVHADVAGCDPLLRFPARGEAAVGDDFLQSDFFLLCHGSATILSFDSSGRLSRSPRSPPSKIQAEKRGDFFPKTSVILSHRDLLPGIKSIRIFPLRQAIGEGTNLASGMHGSIEKRRKLHAALHALRLSAQDGKGFPFLPPDRDKRRAAAVTGRLPEYAVCGSV